MIYLLFILSAAVAYLLCGINPAIILSKAVYRSDIRNEGSGNPGFTNFKRAFGWKLAWLVLLLDILKSVLPCAISGLLFAQFYGMWQIGVAYTGFFSMLGHAYPVWYKFSGGKAFLVGAGVIWLVDWRVGAIATLVFAFFLFVIKYMSLASIVAALVCPVAMAFLGFSHISVILFCIAGSALVVWRHRSNIVRLIAGTESKFHFVNKDRKRREGDSAF